MKATELEDLKQFILSVVSQSEARLGKRIDRLEKKVDDGFAAVGEAIDNIHEH